MCDRSHRGYDTDVIASERAVAAAGCGRLRVVSAARGGSVVTEAYATSPLRLLTPRNVGRAAWIYTSSFGGGLVDGDDLILDVDVEDQATAFLATQASTKVYRSAAGTKSSLRARVGRGALLVSAPDPVVCFTGARYRQLQLIDLAADAGVIVVDVLSSGRHASGERWAFDSYAATLRVRMAGRLVIHDALALRAADADIGERVGRFNVLALMLMLGPQFRTQSVALIRDAARHPVEPRAACLCAVTPVGDGCLVRFAGTALEPVMTMVRAQLAWLPPMLGDDPWARKW